MRRNKKIYRLLVIVLILCLSIGYAVLNSTLKINGTSNIQKNTWDVHFESIYIVDGSVDPVVEPTISDDVNINFELTLDKPGDYFEFYVDVVNRGTIDAMISSFQKTPDLTEEQKKYINYTIEYQNGEQITKNQLVKANSFSRLKVKVEYKKDLIASDLPTTDESLNLGFIVNYLQADESGSLVTNNGTLNELITIKSGNGRQTGDEVCIKDECFYVLESDDEKVSLFAKYNLMVGNMVDEQGSVTPIENPSGLQSPLAIGGLRDDNYVDNVYPIYGVMKFSDEHYWVDQENISIKSKYSKQFEGDFMNNYMEVYSVYDENSNLYQPIENYKSYLETKGVVIENARLINAEELYNVAYYSETEYIEPPEWVYNTSYWTGLVTGNYPNELLLGVWAIYYDPDIFISVYNNNNELGVRPVIEISLSELYSNKK